MIETKFGNYEIVKDYRNAFDLEKFEARYIEECFDKYTYLVGDISSDVLRIKGFSLEPKSKNFYKFIPDYITESCLYNAPYFILKKIRR